MSKKISVGHGLSFTPPSSSGTSGADILILANYARKRIIKRVHNIRAVLLGETQPPADSADFTVYVN